MLSAVKRTIKTCTEGQILFQFVPEQLVIGSFSSIGARESDLETLCFSVYNRILQPVDRLMSRQLFEHEVRSYFQEPAFTLARPVHNKVKLVWQAPAGSLDVMDRHTLLHVGYQMTPCGKWILAACVDQRGEAHDLGVWLTQSEANETYVVTQVWIFALQFARKANLEWRIVIAKLGSMGASELDGVSFSSPFPCLLMM
jgi:mediator of RNA polymerase II transcription subunit 13